MRHMGLSPNLAGGYISPSRPSLRACSIWDRWGIPTSRKVRSSNSTKAATAFLISRSRCHFAHRLAMARQIMASQPGWTNRCRSTLRAGDAKPSLVDGIRVLNAVRSIASSGSSTVILGRAEGETNEIDFCRSLQAGFRRCRGPTLLVIAVTAAVPSPCSDAPYRAKPSRKNQRTDQVGSACATAGLVCETEFAPASEGSRVCVDPSGREPRPSRASMRNACSGTPYRLRVAFAN